MPHPWWYKIGNRRGIGYMPYRTRRRFAVREAWRSRRQRIAAAAMMSRLYRYDPKIVDRIKSFL